MANTVNNIAKKKFIDGALNWATADIRALLLTSGYVVDPDDDFVADLTPGSNELTGTGYLRLSLAYILHSLQ